MKPDLTDYDTLDVIALKRADIPIGLCGGEVRSAMKQGLPRGDIADFFLLQLKTAIELDKIDYRVDDDKGRLRPEYFVRTDTLNNWPELEYPPIPRNVADYLEAREGKTKEPTPAPQEFIRRRPDRKIKNEFVFPQYAKKKNGKTNSTDAVKDSPAISTKLMLAMAVKGLGYFDPNHKGKGKQADAVRFFEKQLEKEGLTRQCLSDSTLRDNLDKAFDTLKQYAVLDKKNDK